MQWGHLGMGQTSLKSYLSLKVWICELKVIGFGVILNEVFLNLSFWFAHKIRKD